uniref:BPTI/Kunitz inhibitor domain-containing protein n=1 Tax=Timema bartmani TaxID=61472 RepID=A0A7R9ERG9_9NEOP|nr:unnamed protein product [Timema bartmani]
MNVRVTKLSWLVWKGVTNVFREGVMSRSANMWVRCSESLLLAYLCCTWMCPVASLPAAETGPNGQIPEHCTLPPDKGVCRSFVHKWFYDTAAKKCFTFIYGGCPGNDNRFDSQADCLLSCAQGNSARYVTESFNFEPPSPLFVILHTPLVVPTPNHRLNAPVCE